MRHGGQARHKMRYGGQALVRLKVCDLLGREVAALMNEHKIPGAYSVTWNASGFSSGICYYAFQAGEFRETRRMILLKERNRSWRRAVRHTP